MARPILRLPSVPMLHPATEPGTMLIQLGACLLFLILAPPVLAQSKPAPLELGGAPLRPGLVQGIKIGANGADSGFVAKLPRTQATGTASSAIEIDTLDFRPKWTMRLRLTGHDSLEIVIRAADTLPPEPRPYKMIMVWVRGIPRQSPVSGRGNDRLRKWRASAVHDWGFVGSDHVRDRKRRSGCGRDLGCRSATRLRSARFSETMAAPRP